jgi:predicted ferric reductase
MTTSETSASHRRASSSTVARGGIGATTPTQMRRPVTRPWWRGLAGALAYAGGLVVVALWVGHGGIQELQGARGWLTGTGRLAGLLASYLMLLQVFMMARVPFVERSYGQDELARRHRLIGFTSFTLMLAHVGLILTGYALTDGRNVVPETWHLVVTYPGMLLAAAGFAALVMVVVTSLRAARRRLRYESWHLLHLYAYLGAGLALPHQLWTGADFVATSWARVFWWSVYALALGSVLGYRVAVPLYRSLVHRLVVERVVLESPGVVSVWLRGRQLERLPVAAGQFFYWRFLDGAGWSRAHPYSLSAAPGNDRLRITVKDLGDDSSLIASLRPGARVLVEGPYGRLTGAVRTRRKVTLLAGGIGITPLRALLEELPQAPGDVTLVYRASSERDLIFRAELQTLAASRGARVLYAVGPRVVGRDSWLPDSARHLDDVAALRHLVPDVAEHDVYVCGGRSWTAAAIRAAREVGVPRERIHLERFSW